jgi:hypothetical protein
MEHGENSSRARQGWVKGEDIRGEVMLEEKITADQCHDYGISREWHDFSFLKHQNLFNLIFT